MRPSFIDDYIRISKEINRLESEKKSLRPRVMEVLEETGGFIDIGILTKTRTEWHEDVIYDWLKTAYPEYVDDLSKVTIDLERFGEYCKKGKIDSSLIPLTVTTSVPQKEIHIKKEKKGD